MMSTMPSAKELWLKGLPRNTRRAYEYWFDRLLTEAKVTADQLLEATKKDMQMYTQLKMLANSYSEHGRNSAISAMRNFLYASGIESLPAARLKEAHRVKPSPYMTWEQANAICAAASRPYNMIFKLMLNCGWGVSEFLKFNMPETWRTVKAYFEKDPQAQYYRFNFSGRKSNIDEYYALVPKTFLQEMMSVLNVPISVRRRKGGEMILCIENYEPSRQYIESAWRTALKRAPVVVQGTPTVHDLRDTLRTRGTFVNAAPEATNFVMGHKIDPLNYDKCFRNETFIWTEISKILAIESIDQQRKKTVLDNLRLLGMSEEEINEIQRVVDKRFGHMATADNLLDVAQERLDAKKQKEGKPSMTNGGKTYDAMLVSEDDLCQYLEMGWEVVSVVNNKVAIRRPTK